VAFEKHAPSSISSPGGDFPSSTYLRRVSDMQCPATILLVAREAIATGGKAMLGARQLSGLFVASAVAADPGGLAAATSLADQGAWRLSTMADVDDGASLARAMNHLADLHRGETIAVVASQDMIDDVVGNATAISGEPIAVAIDGSGWSVSPAT
jgi:hypothetical protein